MFQEVNVKLSNGKVIKVKPRVIIKNGYFWAIYQDKMDFYSFEQIVTNPVKQLQKKLTKLRI